MVSDPRDSQKVEIPAHSFVRRTGQLWKLVLGSVVLPVPVVAWGWWTLRSIRPDQPGRESAVHLGLLVAGAGLIAALLASVRCPRCKGSLLKGLMQAPEGADAIVSFLKQKNCPLCGYDPDAGSAPR